MPIKDYECKSCSHEFEHMTISQSEQNRIHETLKCPKCGSRELEVSPVPKKTSFRLKGSGWARDGYK